MFFDCHSHTKFSADSKMTAEDAIKKAESLNLGIIFTEHFDFDIPGELDFSFNPKEYFSEYEKFRGEKVRLGVEIGLQKSAVEANKNFLAQADFDMVIGSIHVVDNFDIYFPEFFAGKNKITAYKEYFAAMIENISEVDFDILGHIDYICRNAPYENNSLEYEIFQTEIDEVLKILIEREKVLELNTRRLEKKSVLYELLPIYKKYKELGGKFITIGSDAHKVETVGANFKIALNFAEELNLIPVTFSNRKILY
ncbi:MAG: histidinol-phosphatase HisJ family protein [Selenomonadaceae bacterium]|nr:histidinol-phosphatase HisJ family protein [Selenomonadaceae bacterium]